MVYLSFTVYLHFPKLYQYNMYYSSIISYLIFLQPEMFQNPDFFCFTKGNTVHILGLPTPPAGSQAVLHSQTQTFRQQRVNTKWNKLVNNFTSLKVLCFYYQKRSKLGFTTKGVELFSPQDQRSEVSNSVPIGPTNLELSHLQTVHSVENR